MSGPTFSLADVAALLEAATSGSKSKAAPEVLEGLPVPAASAPSTSAGTPSMAQLLAAMASTTGAAAPTATPAEEVAAPIEAPAARAKQAAGKASNASGLAALVPLLREVNDLKRIRSALHLGTWASRCFARSWARILGGEEIERVALQETARAVAAARLADLDVAAMLGAGLSREEALQVLGRALESSGAPLYRGLRERLSLALGDVALGDVAREEAAASGVEVPEFVRLLLAQPRAGATRAGVGRVVLEPMEMHGDHCAIVAVNAVLLAPLYGANVGEAFLTGLTHHLHNAWWPDAGEVGDSLVGESLAPAMQKLREKALAQLPEELRPQARASLEVVYRADTPQARAFQAADVLDRVLEMEWHARSAAFTLDVALHEMDIAHPGPVQEFQQQVMRESGLA